MDALTFIAKVLEITAWPVAAVVLVALLRVEIRTLVPMLRKLKAGPVEAEFERKAEDLAVTLQRQPKAEEIIADTRSAMPELTYTLGESPRSAILEAWLRLESEASQALGRQAAISGGPGAMTTRPSPRALATSLRRAELLNEEQIRMLEELRAMRNEVVHALDFVPTHEAIHRYLESAKYLSTLLSRSAGGA